MASSSSSSQHESLLARSCSSLPSIDALVAQLVALHRAQEGDIDDNNNLEGGAAGAGYTLTAKKKVADNYCRWLRYAVTESSPGAIKSLLRLLPYPPVEDATQAAEDDEARKVVKLLLANKLMSILTDAFDAMVNTLPQSEEDLYLWRHEHRDVELTPSPAIVLENILGSLDELCLIHPTGVNVAPFLTRCVKLLVTCRTPSACKGRTQTCKRAKWRIPISLAEAEASIAPYSACSPKESKGKGKASASTAAPPAAPPAPPPS